MATTTQSLVRYAEIYHLSESLLSRWRKDGVDLDDSREVFRKLWNSRTSAPEWTSLLDELRADLNATSEKFWRREKVRAEAQRIELANGLTRGEQMKREDVDAANMALGSAFKLATAEAQSVLPPQLVGLAEAEIEKALAATFRKMLGNLADLESTLWSNVLAKYQNAGDRDGESVEPAPKKARNRKIGTCK